MDRRCQALSKLFALWLVFLSVSPHTQPFAITDLIDVLHHKSPVGGHVVSDALLKAKTATAPIPIEQTTSGVRHSSTTLAGPEYVAYDGPPQCPGFIHRILRL